MFVAQLAGCNDLTLLEVLRVTGIDNNLLTPDTVVLLREVELINNLLLEERGITRLVDLYLTHHLTYNNLKVLVVDLYTL